MLLSSLLSLYIANAINFESPPLEKISGVENSIAKTVNQKFQKLPIKNPKLISPIIEAESSIAIDLETGQILYEKNAHDKRSIASITKLMTVLIVLEENKMSEIATVSRNAAITEGSTMYLRENEEIAIENLIYGALINSANDAAITLAEYNAGSVSKFVEKMNVHAKKLGLLNTHFSNPIGLDQLNNYSSAYDLAKLAKNIYKYDFVRHAASTLELEVKSSTGKYTHKLKSTNELLDSYLNIKGLKTGHTAAAGLCLVSVALNNTGNAIITVVLDSPARFKETKILTDWIFRAYNWQ